MRRNPDGWVLGVIVGVVVGVGVDARAADPPPDRLLEKHGLKRSGSLFVATAEEAVHDRAAEVRDLMRQLDQARARQRATVGEKEYQGTVKALTGQLNALKAESNLATQNLNRLPKFRTRRGTYYANNYVTEQAQELTYYRKMLQMEISQRQTFLNQLKSQKFDPRDRLKADADVDAARAALAEAVQGLRQGVDQVRAKYDEAAKDPEVKKWLQIPEGSAGVKPKLGPSHAFQLDAKLLDRAERTASATSGDDPFAPTTPATPARKGRRGGRTRRADTSAKSDPF